MSDESANVPEVVRDRATRTFAPDTFERWLIGREPFLNGRRPIDVINAGDIEAVLTALDAIDAGDF